MRTLKHKLTLMSFDTSKIKYSKLYPRTNGWEFGIEIRALCKSSKLF